MHSSVPGRSLFATALIIAACTIGATPAAASSVSLSGDTLTYTAVPGEKNDLSVSKWDGTILVSEKKVKITPGTGCTKINAKKVSCTGASATTHVEVLLDDMNDHLRLAYVGARTNDDWATSLVFGGEGSDILRGGDADDTLHGEDGDDYITDGWGDDSLFGGPGQDFLFSGFGDDLLDGGPDTDTLQSYRGNDTLIQ